MAGFLARYGARLLEQGYPIVPIKPGFKYPRGLAQWGRLNATENHLKKWLSNGFAQGGVGVLARHTPAVDIDVQDADIAGQVAAWCQEHIGATVQRVGEAPKTLLVYRAQEPFNKLRSRRYRDLRGREHKVEVLGDGQQFVAFAVHPDTKRPYRWITEKSLVDVAQNDLPLIYVEQAQALVDYFESIAPDDWAEVEVGQRAAKVDYSLSEEAKVLLNAKPRLGISENEIRKAVNELDPNMGRADWVKVGMGLFHQFEGSPSGFDIWDRWSCRGATYNPSEMRSCWRSFATDFRKEPATAATVLWMAKQKDPENDEEKTPLEGFLKRYVFVEQGNLVCDLNKPPHCALSKLEEFRNATANIRHLVPAPTKSAPEREKLQPVHQAWLVDRNRKSAQGTCYDPSKPFFFKDAQHGALWWVNECHLPTFDTHAKGDTSLFREHMGYLFPAERERNWFIDWMAFNLQYPGRRCKVTPLHVSIAHGTGRGWLVELMGKLLGQWNCTKTKMHTLSGEGSSGAFQDYLDRSLFCAIEEVREGKGRYAISDKTRDVLESPYLEVNVKHGLKRTQAVFTNFFLMSNHPDALVLTKEDRRINVFSGPNAARDRQYYRRLYRWSETDGVAVLHRELMARDLADFDWQCSFETPARRQMICNARTETENLFHDFLEDPPCPVMTFQQIVRALVERSDGDVFDNNIEEGQLTKLLQHHATGPMRVRAGGKVRRAWQLVAEKSFDMKEIKEMLVEYGL